MSAETKASLAEAIRAHIADELDMPDIIIADWCVATAAIRPPDFGTGVGRYDLIKSDGGLYHGTLGLLAWAIDFHQHPEEG